MQELLFNLYDLSANLRNFLERLPEQVDQIPEGQFHISSDEQIVESLKSVNTLQPLVLHTDKAVMDQTESKMDVRHHRDRALGHEGGPLMVPSTKVIVKIPFTGDDQLWQCKPSRTTLNPPRGHIAPRRNKDTSGTLTMDFEQPADVGPQVFKEPVEREISKARDYVGFIKTQIDEHNQQLEGRILPAIQARRARLKQNSAIADLLGIPMVKKDDAPPFDPIHVEKRIVVELPPEPKGGVKPEPGILDKTYDDILSIIRHEGRTFEATPKTYSVHGEEDLRNIMLAHLNGHYKGGATGETFRRTGKTDIRIEEASRAAFVAECKVWRGAGEITEALDQLTNYLTWRDCKAALVVFNKDVRGFMEIVNDKLPLVLREHPCFIEMHPTEEAGEWKCLFRSKEDEGRRIQVRVQLFNLYT